MSHTHNAHEREGGNAVTLTLLGLAIAILAGVAVLYYMGKSTAQPVAYPAPEDTVHGQVQEEESLIDDIDPREGWNTYTDTEYAFAFEYPAGWAVATGTIFGSPVVTVYDAAQKMASTTFGVHESDTRVSVYPHGMPTEQPADLSEQSDIIIIVPEASARNLVLGSGRPWATIAGFEKYPASWTEAGYLFARVAIEEEEVGYMRGDTGISAEEFDVYTGDHIVRYGYVDTEKRDLTAEIIRSFTFVAGDAEEEAVTESGVTASDMIRVVMPEPFATITSPLTVEGEAVGAWYFEGDFSVRLVDAAGVTLAEVPVTALDEWMTEDFVPFEVSFAFTGTSATSGTLIFERSNPSGARVLDAQLEVPVYFKEVQL